MSAEHQELVRVMEADHCCNNSPEHKQMDHVKVYTPTGADPPE